MTREAAAAHPSAAHAVAAWKQTSSSLRRLAVSPPEESPLQSEPHEPPAGGGGASRGALRATPRLNSAGESPSCANLPIVRLSSDARMASGVMKTGMHMTGSTKFESCPAPCSWPAPALPVYAVASCVTSSMKPSPSTLLGVILNISWPAGIARSWSA